MTSIKRWLAPPYFDDEEEKTRLALLLNSTILIVQLYMLLLFGSNLLGGSIRPGNLIITIIVFIACLPMRYWLFRGMIKLTGGSLVILGILAITASVATAGSIYSPSSALYLFPVFLSGIVLGISGILATGIVCSLAMAGLILTERLGMLPAPNYAVTITQWITFTFRIGLAGHITYFAYQTIADALKRTQREIKERKHSEEALHESEERWQFALEGAGDGVWDWNAQTNQVFFSPRWKAMLGFEPGEIGDTLDEWDKRIHPDDRAATYDKVNRHLSGETDVYVSEHRLQCKDGSYKWILDRGIVISRTLDGRPLRVIGTHTDITERKFFEEALRKSEVRFRSLFEQTNDAVFILDLAGQHLAVNEGAAYMLGYTVEEMIGLSMLDISAEIDESSKILDRLIAGENIPIYERKFRRKNGQVFPVEINVKLVQDNDGNPLHIQSVVRDISRRKQAEEALKNANEQLMLHIAEVEKLHEELSEQALHDPLTGLYNRRYLAEMLEREIMRAEREQIFLGIIVSDIDHFKKINDTYGHQVGDKLLVETASLMKRSTRGMDIVCRYGGEEFIMVLPGADAASAARRAETIRQECARVILSHAGEDLTVTISFGVASYPEHGKNAEEIIIKADKALYQSKEAGRNRVTIWGEEIPA